MRVHSATFTARTSRPRARRRPRAAMVSRSVAFTLIASVLLIFIIAAHASPRRARRRRGAGARPASATTTLAPAQPLGRGCRRSTVFCAASRPSSRARRRRRRPTRAATRRATPRCNGLLGRRRARLGPRQAGLPPQVGGRVARRARHATTCSQPGSEHTSWWPDRPNEVAAARRANMDFCPRSAASPLTFTSTSSANAGSSSKRMCRTRQTCRTLRRSRGPRTRTLGTRRIRKS